MKIRLILIFLLLFVYSTFSQADSEIEDLKEIPFSSLLKKMLDKSDTIFSLKNARVTFDEKEDQYLAYEYRHQGKEYPSDFIHITKAIYFENVHFVKKGNFQQHAFVNFKFHKSFEAFDTDNLICYNCRFDRSFNFQYNSRLGKGLNKYLRVEDCTFNSKFTVNGYAINEQLNITIDGNTFHYLGSENHAEFMEDARLILHVSNAEVFSFDDNQVNYEKATFQVQLSDIKELYFSKNTIKSNFWNYWFMTNVADLTLLDNNIDSDLLFGIDKLNGEYNLQWPITNERMIPLHYIFTNQAKFKEVNNKILNSVYENGKVSDLSYYKNDLTLLSKFHSHFKEFHDRQSANDVYLRIKDLETERLEYLYNQDKSFENYFELTVNRFLKRFSNYGTSPSKIVISSFNIILIFALLFLFSTNSWNKIYVGKFNKGIENAIGYFTSNKSLVHSFELDQNRIDANSSTKVILNDNRKKIPRIFSFFSGMYISIQSRILKMKRSFWSKIDLVKNEWTDLSPVKKFLYSSLMVLVTLFFFILKVLSLLLNALTLSINSFTTLGFGEIPIKGIGRYLAIIEGFIGWVFLTLFSVTLISQILS